MQFGVVFSSWGGFPSGIEKFHVFPAVRSDNSVLVAEANAIVALA
jgi:hypothetical protein